MPGAVFVTYLWHYFLARLLWQQVTRGGGSVLVVLLVVVLAAVGVLVGWRLRRRSGR